MTKIFQHDIHHWSLEEFIRLIVIKTEIPIHDEQLIKHILHEIKKIELLKIFISHLTKSILV
jgi:DNA polymerase III psi subunit